MAFFASGSGTPPLVVLLLPGWRGRNSQWIGDGFGSWTRLTRFRLQLLAGVKCFLSHHGGLIDYYAPRLAGGEVD